MRSLVTFPRRKLPQIADATLAGIAHWALDEASGTTAADFYALSNLTASSSSTVEAPIYKADASAKGRGRATAAITITGASTAGQRTELAGDWTLEAIVTADTITTDKQTIVVHGSTGSGSADNDLVNLSTRTDGRLRMAWHSGTQTVREVHSIVGVVAADTKHHHIAVRKKTVSTVIYVSFFYDGAHVGTSIMAAAPAGGSSGSWSVGAEVGGTVPFDGKIYDVRIVARAMSESFVRENAHWALQKYDVPTLLDRADPAPAPVLTGLTHWTSAQDTLYAGGTTEAFFYDRSGFVFTESPYSGDRATAFQGGDGGGGGGLYIASSLNGLPGLRCKTGGAGIRTAPVGTTTVLEGTHTKTESILDDDYTMQWLVQIGFGTAFSDFVQTYVGTGMIMQTTGDGTQVEIAGGSGNIALGSPGTLDPKLLTFRCSADALSVYVDNNFVTPAITFTYTPPITSGNVAMFAVGDGFADDSFRPIFHELLVYNRALTDAELQQNYDYLVGEWGAW